MPMTSYTSAATRISAAEADEEAVACRRLRRSALAPKFSAMIENRPAAGHSAAHNSGRFWYRRYRPAV